MCAAAENAKLRFDLEKTPIRLMKKILHYP